MRYQSVLAKRKDGFEVAMTPMIDVVFMLLIFFVWTASFQVAELILPSSLVSPEAEAGNTQAIEQIDDLERIVVRISYSSSERLQWTVNDVPLKDFALVKIRLEAIAKIRSDLPVLVDPDPQVPLGAVIDVYDAARYFGLENVQFATPVPTAGSTFGIPAG